MDNADSENVITFHRRTKDPANCEPEPLAGDGLWRDVNIVVLPVDGAVFGHVQGGMNGVDVERTMQSCFYDCN